jgi:hypothetical protein
VTFTLTVHVPPAAIVPPENDTDPALATGAKVGVPHPKVEYVAGVATIISPGAPLPVIGKVSVKATFGSASLGFGLVRMKVNVLVPFGMIVSRSKYFEI